jgi:hypothetical protein
MNETIYASLYTTWDVSVTKTHDLILHGLVVASGCFSCFGS